MIDAFFRLVVDCQGRTSLCIDLVLDALDAPYGDAGAMSRSLPDRSTTPSLCAVPTHLYTEYLLDEAAAHQSAPATTRTTTPSPKSARACSRPT
ncbi:hypothetical protein K7472_07450 [Streptomyces sp. PTM05]|uniref:Uncharacterized protein n=1 Tax=Streptantibioticus parmotrematis TaxID=2873249 RepID=A0ABS7QND4_9ACTN|nr:hypothetical protein [Streptantibioticus parmotrematis]MBY8884679.1 hypothetical protein [Streptantibioticus parmotrematis]